MAKEPVFWGALEQETLSAMEMDDAIESILNDMDGSVSELPEKIMVCGFAPMEIGSLGAMPEVLENLLERLDEDYGNPDGDATKPTNAMLEAEKTFLEVVRKEYTRGLSRKESTPWACEKVCQQEIVVRDWIKANRPDWLEEGQA